MSVAVESGSLLEQREVSRVVRVPRPDDLELAFQIHFRVPDRYEHQTVFEEFHGHREVKRDLVKYNEEINRVNYGHHLIPLEGGDEVLANFYHAKLGAELYPEDVAEFFRLKHGIALGVPFMLLLPDSEAWGAVPKGAQLLAPIRKVRRHAHTHSRFPAITRHMDSRISIDFISPFMGGKDGVYYPDCEVIKASL